jgi:kynurenine formamidase
MQLIDLSHTIEPGMPVFSAAGFTFHGVPVKVAGAAAFPVRAYAAVNPETGSSDH